MSSPQNKKKASPPFHTKSSTHTYTHTQTFAHSHTHVTIHSCQPSQAPPSLCCMFTKSTPPLALRPGLGRTVIGNLSQPYYFSYQPFQSTSKLSAFSPSFLHLIYFLVFSQQFLQTLSLSTGLINLLFLSSGAVVCCLALQEGSPTTEGNRPSSSQLTHLQQLTTGPGTYSARLFFVFLLLFLFFKLLLFFPDKDTPWP